MATRTDTIRENRDYIIREYTQRSKSIRELAAEFGVAHTYLTRMISDWRDDGLLDDSYPNTPLENDRELITELYEEGVAIPALAEKWEAPIKSLHSALVRWGVHEPTPRASRD